MSYQPITSAQTSRWARLMRTGKFCYHDGNYQLAEVYFVAAAREALEQGHFKVAISKSLHWWALSCREQGKYAKAQRLFAQSYKARQRGDPLSE